MRRSVDSAVQVVACVLSLITVMWLLGERPPAPAIGSTPVVAVRFAPVTAGDPLREPLFADSRLDASPTKTTAGPPQLVGIVGRLSAPLVMVRVGEGAIRTIAPGETIDGWTLAGVAADRAFFKRGKDERVAVLPARDEPPQ
ncbi:hypothetical protein Q4F19_04390 [Sphingomonas sp. BIUV-7]|uniref:Type II secretion system protein GspC N-terminal domain-containing protein n=1 Tax=Sphingomonas natans TaxID=3063330 RepID=A0ABT8Y5M1_9SPHN|nr:hypothetical protein [Sphingomonas sp. BIUV-7]MDO6413615.1 hypothetical protein [Sphingomonas sp. BIUV-7]